MHAESKDRAIQPVPMAPAEPVPGHRRPPTPHPSVSVKARNAISDALLHDNESARRELNENLRREAGAAGRGDETNAQEFGLHAGDGACFARGGGAGVNLLILRVDIRHGALQDNADRGWRGAEDGLPAHAVPESVVPVKLGNANCVPEVALPGKVSLLKLKPTSPEKSELGGVVF